MTKPRKGADPHNAGHPRNYKNAKELEKKCEEYINNCPDVRYIQTGFSLTTVPHPTITGLALFLGYESRQSCYDNEKIPEYSYIIKKTKLFIEKNYESLLAGNNAAGPIFALKNMGWSDKQEIHNIDETKRPDFSNLTDKELKIRAAIDKKIYGDKHI